jgi:hypothetical protein
MKNVKPVETDADDDSDVGKQILAEVRQELEELKD